MPGLEIEKRIRQVFERVLEIEPERVAPEARLTEDLGADSLDVFRLVLAVEEEFGTAITDEEAEGFRTVGALLNWVATYAPA